MENKQYIQAWRISIGFLSLVIGLVLAIWVPVYWYNHDQLTRMQLIKEIWYIPTGAFVCLLFAKYQVEKFKKLNAK
jgi:hypothetical protein